MDEHRDNRALAGAAVPGVAGLLVAGAAAQLVAAFLVASNVADRPFADGENQLRTFLIVLGNHAGAAGLTGLIAVGLLALSPSPALRQQPVLLAALAVLVPTALATGVATVLELSESSRFGMGGAFAEFDTFDDRVSRALGMAGWFALAAGGVWLAGILLRRHGEPAAAQG